MANIPQGYVPLQGSERNPAPGSQRVGPANENETITVTIILRRRTGSLSVPSEPPQGRMPRAEFEAKYGASLERSHR